MFNFELRHTCCSRRQGGRKVNRWRAPTLAPDLPLPASSFVMCDVSWDCYCDAASVTRTMLLWGTFIVSDRSSFRLLEELTAWKDWCTPMQWDCLAAAPLQPAAKPPTASQPGSRTPGLVMSPLVGHSQHHNHKQSTFKSLFHRYQTISFSGIVPYNRMSFFNKWPNNI